jgi:hypothetical protein
MADVVFNKVYLSIFLLICFSRVYVGSIYIGLSIVPALHIYSGAPLLLESDARSAFFVFASPE